MLILSHMNREAVARTMAVSSFAWVREKARAPCSLRGKEDIQRTVEMIINTINWGQVLGLGTVSSKKYMFIEQKVDRLGSALLFHTTAMGPLVGTGKADPTHTGSPLTTEAALGMQGALITGVGPANKAGRACQVLSRAQAQGGTSVN